MLEAGYIPTSPLHLSALHSLKYIPISPLQLPVLHTLPA
jgi:hypothetical protein